MSAHHGGIEHLNEMCGLAHRCQRIEEGFEHPGLAQAPKALPDSLYAIDKTARVPRLGPWGTRNGSPQRCP